MGNDCLADFFDGGQFCGVEKVPVFGIRFFCRRLGRGIYGTSSVYHVGNKMSIVFNTFMAVLSFTAAASEFVLSTAESSPYFIAKGVGFLLVGIGYIMEIWRKMDG